MLARQFNSRLSLSFALLALILGAALVAQMVWVATRTDKLTEDHEAALLQRALTETLEDINHQQQSVTIWDELVEEARLGDRHWLDENVGEWMYSFYGHDRVFILDGQDHPIYSMAGGRGEAPAAYEAFAPELSPLVDRLRKEVAVASSRGDVSVQDVTMIGGKPAIVSLKAIVPSSHRLSVPAGEEYVYISVVYMSDARMRGLGERHLLSGVRLDPSPSVRSDEGSLPLLGSKGPVGYAIWQKTRPGRVVVQETVPLMAIGAVCLVGALVWLTRRLRRTAARLQTSERQANFLAFHDPLTGLPNRALFGGYLGDALRNLPAGTGLALLLLDLDRFKSINDTLGHAAGDELIRQAAARLESRVERSDIARLGGDQFAIVVRAGDADKEAERLAGQLLEAVRQPFELLGNQAFVNASIGMALASHDGVDAAELQRQADLALREAKARGRYCKFRDELDRRAHLKRQIESDLRAALASTDQLHLDFQPIYAADGRTIVGAEALMRWDHPLRGPLSPAIFIPVAEESGLVEPIGIWGLERTCRMLQGVDLPWIALNVSSIELKDPHYARRVLEILERNAVNPRRLQLEITEGVLLQKEATTTAALQRLRHAGIRIALDDFGTGYSSLQYLHQYQVDKIKIDRSFVRPLGSEAGAEAIVRAMLDLGRAFHIAVTAEGVETPAQFRRLVEMGCGELQGYLLSRPIDGDALVRLYRASILPKAEADRGDQRTAAR